MRYFITFACYGAHLHGDESGSVDRWHNLPGSRLLEADPRRVSEERHAMTQAPYLLDGGSREAVLKALLEDCLHRDWSLLAAHLSTLAAGIAIDEPRYLFDRHTRSAETTRIEPRPFLMLEGIPGPEGVEYLIQQQ